VDVLAGLVAWLCIVGASYVFVLPRALESSGIGHRARQVRGLSVRCSPAFGAFAALLPGALRRLQAPSQHSGQQLESAAQQHANSVILLAQFLRPASSPECRAPSYAPPPRSPRRAP
jgi:hypothetical protein